MKTLLIMLLLLVTTTFGKAQKITEVVHENKLERHHECVNTKGKNWITLCEADDKYYISFIKLQRSRSKNLFKHDTMSVEFTDGSVVGLNKTNEYWEEYDDEFYQHTVMFEIELKDFNTFKSMGIVSYNLFDNKYRMKDKNVIMKQIQHLYDSKPKHKHQRKSLK